MIQGITEMNKHQDFEQAEQIRTFFSYLHRFRGNSFVFHIDAALFLAEDGARRQDSSIHLQIQELARDTALLMQSGINVVVVFEDILLRSDANDIESHHPIEHVASLRYAMQFLGAAKRFGCGAVMGNWVEAQANTTNGKHTVTDIPTIQAEGQPQLITTQHLSALFEQSCIPVFPSMGWNRIGKWYRLDSKDLALSIAVQIRAEKLFFVTQTQMFHQFFAETKIAAERRNVMLQDLEKSDKRYSPNIKKLIEWISYAIKQGIPRVHIVEGNVHGNILVEAFSHAGNGCMIHSDIYEKIRSAKLEDLADIEHIVRPLEEKGYLRVRDHDELHTILEHTVIHETDGSIEACCALVPLSKDAAELAMLALAEGYKMLGIGKKLVQYLLAQAKKEGYSKVFAFTRRSVDWFYAQGFRSTNIDAVARQRRELYNNDNSASAILMIEL